MIAEIHHKISANGSNLTERLEDELTGNFFGNMRYLPFEIGMKKILKATVYPQNVWNENSLDLEGEWSEYIKFWPRYKEDKKRTEIDVVIEFTDVIIGIEVKLHSGLSSDDDITYANTQEKEDIELSKNQLAREAELLKMVSHGKKEVVLLFLANELDCQKVYKKIIDRQLMQGVKFGYMTWQKIYESMKQLQSNNSYEMVILNDLKELLNYKEFDMFKNFTVDEQIDKNLVWYFSQELDFTVKEKIDRRLYYEFG